MPKLRKTDEEKANLNFIGELDKRKRVNGLSDSEIAEMIGISRQCLYQWKKHPEKITVGKLRRMYRKLNIPPDEILAFVS